MSEPAMTRTGVPDDVNQPPLRFLVVVAHPHDFSHSAGTCGIHCARGDSVTVVSMTGGTATHNERLRDELLKPEQDRDVKIIDQTEQTYADPKAKELRQACGLFGISDVRILPFSDKPFCLAKTPEAVPTLVDIRYEVRPHVMITQSPYLAGPHGLVSGAQNDHTETAFAAIEAARLVAQPDYATKRIPHTIAAIYYPGVYFTRHQIDFYMDISAWAEKRVAAEMLFRSQGHSEAYARKSIEISAGEEGWNAGTAYAEGFVRATAELLPHIIVPQTTLRRASESYESHMQRLLGNEGTGPDVPAAGTTRD